MFPFRLPPGYFSQNNINRVRASTELLLKPHFNRVHFVDDASIKRVMHRVIDERLEPLPKMFDRAAMYIASEIKEFELEKNRNLDLEKGFRFVGGVYDILGKMGPDLAVYKPSKNVSTVRFYHTYGFVG
jgi:hypothetical protein